MVSDYPPCRADAMKYAALSTQGQPDVSAGSKALIRRSPRAALASAAIRGRRKIEPEIRGLACSLFINAGPLGRSRLRLLTTC